MTCILRDNHNSQHFFSTFLNVPYLNVNLKQMRRKPQELQCMVCFQFEVILDTIQNKHPT